MVGSVNAKCGVLQVKYVAFKYMHGTINCSSELTNDVSQCGLCIGTYCILSMAIYRRTFC